MKEFEVTIKAIVRVADESELDNLIIVKLEEEYDTEVIITERLTNGEDHFEVVEYTDEREV